MLPTYAKGIQKMKLDPISEIESYAEKVSLRGISYTTKFAPYDHQAKALDLMRDREEFALLMAMRTGKSKTTLDDFGDKFCRDLVDDLLIIAPAGVYRTWLTAMADHLGHPLANGGLRVLVWQAKDKGKAAERSLTSFVNAKAVSDAPRALLVNIEALSSVKRAREVCLEFAKQRRCYGAIDESTAIKNPKAERTKFCVMQLGPALAYRRVLTGLISPQSPLDVYPQFAFLKPGLLGFKNFTIFKSRYAITQRMNLGGRWFDQVVGYRDEDDLYERMKPHSYRVRLEDCYDMKEPTYGIREVELTPEQERHYREMKEYATTQLAGEAHVTATIALTKILKLHQILCGFTTDEDGVLHEIPENRTQEVLNTLEEYDGKAIIWCAYDPAIRKVAAALEKAYGAGSVARFWGGNRNTREEEEKLFLNSNRCRFMVATAAAGGRGRTWSNADLTIYHSNTNNLEHRSQSEERTKGVGKQRPVAYLDLVAPDTVDMKILKSLREKWNMADTLQGDGWREWLI